MGVGVPGFQVKHLHTGILEHVAESELGSCSFLVPFLEELVGAIQFHSLRQTDPKRGTKPRESPGFGASGIT